MDITNSRAQFVYVINLSFLWEKMFSLSSLRTFEYILTFIHCKNKFFIIVKKILYAFVPFHMATKAKASVWVRAHAQEHALPPKL